ncbi:hypothetical protein FKR81_26145 [Lentzea tibetensis]|uniref:Uncharacterized protein n=1 Tax=Lentzea tibetensis TaxID=2591470 RepID=A0A563EP26_9PSEU|nr:hypothetical protein [Lentzea tibetensis]TWP49148.1 hypothetical protein FKR81_26145 [Lentzea tibetensis]
MEDLSIQFHRDLVRGVEELVRFGYDGTFLGRMLAAQGGVATARRLIINNMPSYGLWRLSEIERMEMSVEAWVLLPRYESLFDKQLREKAARKLRQFGCDVAETVHALEQHVDTVWYGSARR